MLIFLCIFAHTNKVRNKSMEHLTGKDIEDIVRLRNEGKTLHEIAGYIGCSASTAYRALSRFEVFRKPEVSTEGYRAFLDDCKKNGYTIRASAEKHGFTRSPYHFFHKAARLFGYE